ncbi:MAG TPA: pyridoxal phosphate-dependent aminotransferase [Burkholderiaceae bacterium]|nr:pyridoxal phosphate-dependent aminotransferase [Burkholderiaceae bacterium]
MGIRLAGRTKDVAPFLAMEFGKHALALEAQGHRIIKLNIGEPDFGAPPGVVRAMHVALDERRTAYTAALGVEPLRRAIARHYGAAHGVDVDPQRVIVTAGASAALLLLTAALVDPGDEVLVGDPSYPCNRHFVSSFGGRVKLVPTTTATRYQLDRELVERHWGPQTRGVLVATPSNPTGTSVPFDELAALCGAASARGGWRLVDEIYLGLQDGDAAHPTARSVLAVDPDAIVVSSFSKYFGMTGWRLGWCVVPRELVGAVERLAQNYYICPSSPAQHAAVACFDAAAIAVCEERRARFAQRRELVLRGLASIGLDVPVAPDGAFYVYIDIAATGMKAMPFCELALQEAHVALTPGQDFGEARADEHVRLSYAASEEDLAEALHRLGGLMRRIRGAGSAGTASSATR